MATATPAPVPTVEITSVFTGEVKDGNKVMKSVTEFSPVNQKIIAGYQAPADGPGRVWQNPFALDSVRSLVVSGDIFLYETDSEATDSQTGQELKFKSLKVGFANVKAAIEYNGSDETEVISQLGTAASIATSNQSRNAALRENQDPYEVALVRAAKGVVKLGAFGGDLEKAVASLRTTMTRESLGL